MTLCADLSVYFQRWIKVTVCKSAIYIYPAFRQKWNGQHQMEITHFSRYNHFERILHINYRESFCPHCLWFGHGICDARCMVVSLKWAYRDQFFEFVLWEGKHGLIQNLCTCTNKFTTKFHDVFTDLGRD